MILLKRICLVLALALISTTPAFADAHVYKLYVDGLACPFCAYGIEKQIGGLEGVSSVEIQINEGIVAVTMDAGKILNEENAKEAVGEAGFTLRKFEAGGP